MLYFSCVLHTSPSGHPNNMWRREQYKLRRCLSWKLINFLQCPVTFSLVGTNILTILDSCRPLRQQYAFVNVSLHLTSTWYFPTTMIPRPNTCFKYFSPYSHRKLYMIDESYMVSLLCFYVSHLRRTVYGKILFSIYDNIHIRHFSKYKLFLKNKVKYWT